MKKELNVTVLIPCRDGGPTLRTTIESLLNQTVKTSVAVADDASLDDTPIILKELSKTGRVQSIRYPKREPKNYARVPVLLNMLLNILSPADFYMISGDDCIYPPEYLAKLISFMRNDNVDLASGCHDAKNYKHLTLPSGSGRLVTATLFKRITPLPSSIGWESWMIYKALYLGRRVSVYPIEFKHSRKYSVKSTWTFGQSSYVNGVPLIFTLLRTIKNVTVSDLGFINSLAVLLGHIEYYIRKVEKLDTAPFTRELQLQRLRKSIASILGLQRDLSSYG